MRRMKVNRIFKIFNHKIKKKFRLLILIKYFRINKLFQESIKIIIMNKFNQKKKNPKLMNNHMIVFVI